MRNQLTERQRIEELYHDEAHRSHVVQRGHDRAGEHPHTKSFYKEIGDVSGLRVLEIGCGNGWLGVKLAKAGASVEGIDISTELVNEANREAARQSCSENAVFHKRSIEEFSYDAGTFDMVVGNAILHHIDIQIAMNNIYRVLCPKGRAIFVEPLNENLALKAWRMLTPWRRTTSERALHKSDLDYIQSVFPQAKFKYYGLTSMITLLLLMYFTKSKIIIKANSILDLLDGFLSKAFPFLGPYYAVVVMELRKSEADLQ